MNKKLQDLLDKISFNKEYYDDFKSSKIDKIVVKEDSNTLDIYISCETNLRYVVIDSFVNSLNSYVKNKYIYNVFIKPNVINKNIIEDYYVNILKLLNHNNLYYNMFYNRLVNIDDDYFITVYNKNEESIVKSIMDKISFFYKQFGFDINLKINFDKKTALKIKEEIKNDTVDDEMLLKFSSFDNNKDTTKEKTNTGNYNHNSNNSYNDGVKKGDYYRKNNLPKDDNPNVLFGRTIKDDNIVKIKDITYEADNVTVCGYVFGITLPTKPGIYSMSLKFSDTTSSIYVRLYLHSEEEYNEYISKIRTGMWLKINGYVKNNTFYNDFVLNARNIEKIDSLEEEVKDLEEEKRVELHTHTMMSQMDGVVDVKDLIKQAVFYGHKAIAITDHNAIQTFPECYKHKDEIKILYGVELSMIDDDLDLVLRYDNSDLLSNTYVVFDFETTGFNAGGKDSIIEIGAVKLHDGKIIDRFDRLINPGHKLASHITSLTGITDEMLKDCLGEEEAVKEFIKWTGDLPMVAHNAKFDSSFLAMAYKKYNLGEYKNPLLDTLELSRAINPNAGRHSLSALVKRYDIPFDEESHHRGDYDAEATALIFHKMLEYLHSRNITTMDKINSLVDSKDIHKFGELYHINILVKDKVGLKNLFKIVSYANTKYLYKTPRILRSVVNSLREGLLIGSSCYNGEIFSLARSKSDDELANLMEFYDYIEVQPPEVYCHLIDTEDFKNFDEIEDNIKKIIRVAKEKGKIVVATGDVHHLHPKDKIYREIIINQKVPGGGRHPLNKSSIKNIPSQHYRTTREMLSNFAFLKDDDLIKEIVITNTNKVADLCGEFEIIPDTKGIPFSPIFENSKQIIRDISYGKAHEIYGEELPTIVKERLDAELNGIINGGFDAIYLIAQKLVKHSNDDGYYVGSRGSVGSSFAATMLGITEVNPLPAHYVCPNCKKSYFTDSDGKMYNLTFASGYDLPDRKCECGFMMHKDGHDMPFATFLGFNADKVPDIDLNFSGDYQAKAHEYTKVLFGEEYVYRAGTIGTVADKTAFGFVKGYFEDRGITNVKNLEIERLAIGVTGCKRTTGQHPGGIVVVPNYKDVFDFTPYQYPADDPTSAWATTHFNYHDIESCLLKLDILGHDNPTIFKYLEDTTGVLMKDIPMDDKKVMSLFTSTEALNATPEAIGCQTGALALPEFTKFVMTIVDETKPTTFAELVKISGLSHGTDVWNGNAQDIVRNNIVPFKEVIGCRDDIMVYLMNHGVEPLTSFKIMEFVRKGKASKDKAKWLEYEKLLKDLNIPSWFIESCSKIKYMFPKAHATAYVSAAYKIAWFKVYKPINYYASWFSIKGLSFDLTAMEAGFDKIKERQEELASKGYGLTPKEADTLQTLEVAREASARGFKFGCVSLEKSDSNYFVIDDDNITLIPPFRAIDGLGDIVAKNIIEERSKGEFLSCDDLQRRAKLSSTVIEKMKMMGILKGLPESSQLSLFD